MITALYPDESKWSALAERPLLANADMRAIIEPLFAAVRKQGDSALYHYTEKFDGVGLERLRVPQIVIARQAKRIDAALADAITVAAQNIRSFHEAQRESLVEIEPLPGLQCWRKSVGIERVGLYIPSGSAALFSSLLMLAIPAQLAACREIIVCTPPLKSGEIIPPSIAYVAQLLGLQSIFSVGGAQAIAAMALGTASVPKVDKIFGPGNQYVTAAKQYAAAECGVAVDLPAGPTEVLIVADGSAPPEFVAADLLAQAEHGSDSLVVLVTTSQSYLTEVQYAVAAQLEELPRRAIAAAAMECAKGIVLSSIEEALAFSNLFAPEHLILSLSDADVYCERVINAGSVFVGNYTPESLGDYASGTNHTLPTNGAARGYSGVSLDSFVKKITFQRANAAALKQLAPTVERMAEAEGLDAHARAIRVRFEELER